MQLFRNDLTYIAIVELYREINERVNLYHYREVQISLHSVIRGGRESAVRLIHVGRLDRGRSNIE